MCGLAQMRGNLQAWVSVHKKISLWEAKAGKRRNNEDQKRGRLIHFIIMLSEQKNTKGFCFCTVGPSILVTHPVMSVYLGGLNGGQCSSCTLHKLGVGSDKLLACASQLVQRQA